MRFMGCAWVPVVALGVMLAVGVRGVAQDAAKPLVFVDDFESGLAQWEFTDPNAWEIVQEPDGGHALGLLRASKYQPEVRSPLNIALARGAEFESFELTVRMKQTGEEYSHRDLCLFFGHQDPSHFYYVHLASKADDHANSIFLVNGAPRVSIATRRTDGTKWDDQYHTVKIVRNVDTGSIEVFFDDMDTPVFATVDKTFTSGRVGVGSFDDVGHFDDFHVRGVERR